jgi:hypothetical protein
MELRMLPTMALMVAGVAVTIDATLNRDDSSGQLYLMVRGTAGSEVLELRASIGAADANDALDGMTAAQLKDAVQQALGDARQEMARRLVRRVRVAGIAGQLT